MAPTGHEPQCEGVAKQLEGCFDKVLQEQMQGIPIVNTELVVEAIEFKEYEGRIMGMMLTPWFLNLMILPNADDNWNEYLLGTKEKIIFPAKDLEVMVNEIEGFGRYKSFSLYSPMRDFNNQEEARIAGAIFFRDLLDETKRVEPTYSEEQIQRYLEKEDMVYQEELKQTIGNMEFKEDVNRRDLIRGKLKKEG